MQLISTQQKWRDDHGHHSKSTVYRQRWSYPEVRRRDAMSVDELLSWIAEAVEFAERK